MPWEACPFGFSCPQLPNTLFLHMLAVSSWGTLRRLSEPLPLPVQPPTESGHTGRCPGADRTHTLNTSCR